VTVQQERRNGEDRHEQCLEPAACSGLLTTPTIVIHASWDVSVRGRERLAASLRGRREEAALYRRLATLRTDVPLAQRRDDLEWRGAPRTDLERVCAEIGWEAPLQRVFRWRE
jgi:hypothetical protein